MRTFDLTPLYRATVGFDQIADLMDRALAKDAGTNSYPPYNIEKTADDSWRISIAVAGFSEDDLSLLVQATLTACCTSTSCVRCLKPSNHARSRLRRQPLQTPISSRQRKSTKRRIRRQSNLWRLFS